MVSSILLEWQKLKSIADTPTSPGLYLFCLNDFNEIPFYIGTAADSKNSSLRKRLKENEDKFNQNKSTYLLDTFFQGISNNNLNSFSAQWDKARKEPSKFFFVPNTNSYIPNSEASKKFWNSRLVKYYCEINKDFQSRVAVRAIEATFQNSVRNTIYKNLDLSIPNSSSKLLGQTNASDLKEGLKLHIECIGDGWLAENWDEIKG